MSAQCVAGTLCWGREEGGRLGVGPVHRMSPGLVSVSVSRENAADGQHEQAARGQLGAAAAGPASGREGRRGSGLGRHLGGPSGVGRGELPR